MKSNRPHGGGGVWGEASEEKFSKETLWQYEIEMPGGQQNQKTFSGNTVG